MNIGAGIGVGFSNPREEPSFEYQESQACQNGSDITPVINNPGGTFSSSPAGLSLNANTGVIDVSASTVGNYTITYSIGPTEDTITILPADDSSFSYSSSSFRQNASNPAPIITGLVGGVFSGPTGIIFADSGTNTNSSSGIINLAASTVGGPYTITYTTTGNCPTSSTFNVTVQIALSITYSAASFCEDGGNTAAPTVVGDPGSGTFASTTGLTINSTTGVINTDTSTPDDNTPYTVTYTASTGETATTTVTIKNLDNATFSYSASSFCENASNQTPSITTPGGTFSASLASVNVEYLVVAGGASGGGGRGNGNGSGGGGAGGLRTSFGSTSGGGASAETALTLTAATSYTVTVGAGGAFSEGATAGNDGNNSVFSTITSIGGGGGGAFQTPTDGRAGGAGGGGGATSGNPGSGTVNQGFDGGDHGGGSTYRGGGGGGASAAGASGVSTGNGGDGLAVLITGSSVTYAAGGGGGTYANVNPGTGGAGGGGTGGKGLSTPINATNGTQNTGSGGGGAPSPLSGGTTYPSGAGGSGVVILRYPSNTTISVGAGLTSSTSTSGDFKITVFTAGTDTISFS